MTARCLETALGFARRGHAVVPLWWPEPRGHLFICACKRGKDCPSPAKHPFGPLAPRGILSASSDEALIRGWFLSEPRANYAARTEALICLDIDPRAEGDESLRKLEAEHGDELGAPPTWRSRTGGGGEHIIFVAPHGANIPCSQARDNPILGPGVDIRAKGGYIVCPPSRHISGRFYAWDTDHHPADVPLAPAPPWLLERLRPPPAQARPPEEWKALTQPITSYQDAAAARICGHLLRRYVDPQLAAGLLLAWNEAYCRPRLDGADLKRLFERVQKLETDRRAREGKP